jgi:hypothetical protein
MLKPSATVQFPDNQAIACSELLKALLKLWSVRGGAGLPIIGKNLLAAELLQRGALHAGVLVLD